jgi:hypothetical protein
MNPGAALLVALGAAVASGGAACAMPGVQGSRVAAAQLASCAGAVLVGLGAVAAGLWLAFAG